MRTVQITLDEELAKAVDLAAHRLSQSRSAFTRDALRAALEKLKLQALEQQHREGYLRHPVNPGEFSGHGPPYPSDSATEAGFPTVDLESV